MRIPFALLCLALLPALHGAAPEGEPSLFTTSSWADSSGADGTGGTQVIAGKNAKGAKILPLREDNCPEPIADEGLAEHPAWLVFKDQQGATSLSFEWRWVTHGEDKHWDKTWGGAGLAFNDSWAPLDARGARYLVLMAKASQDDPAFDVRLSLNSSVNGKDVNSGYASLKAFADGKVLGTKWNRVVIPLEKFPKLSSIDLGALGTIGIDLGGTSPENTLCWVRLDNIYFTSSDILTAVDRLGWVPQDGGALLSWDMPESAKPQRFLLSVDGKPARQVDGLLRQALLPASAFPGGKGRVSIKAVRGALSSPELGLDVALKAVAKEAVALRVLPQARHQVSGLIFGNNNLSGDIIGSSGATINRWGGNRKTRYNWKDDTDSAAQDWYYLNESWSNSGKEEDKSWYKFVKESKDRKVEVNLVVPIIDWVAKRAAPGQTLCSYPLSLYPQQASKEGHGCGNGILPDGSRIYGNDPAYNNTPNSPALQEEFVRTVVARFGPASKGGVKYYSMDNEPGLWMDTHRDVKPKGVGYDETARRNIEYAAAVKRADPSAQVLGLVAWGVKELAGSNLDYYPQEEKDGWKHLDKFQPGQVRFADRKKHGDLPLVRWYLQELRRAEQSQGKRLIDALDVHWYPECYGKDSQGQMKRLSSDLPYDEVLAPKQFEALREFWDPSYRNTDSWTANAENGAYFWDPFHPVIPALKSILAKDYPGVRLAMTEYDTGSRSYYHGGLIRAAALGIFMDQDLWMANNWYETDPGKFLYWAHRLYTDYDGKGGNVLGWSFKVEGGHPDLYAFATARKDKAFLILVNKSRGKDLAAAVDLPWPARAVRRYVISEQAGPGIVALPAQAAAGRRVQVQVPAWSALLAEVSLGAAK